MNTPPIKFRDPVAAADWYVKYLGMSVKRAQPERPFGQFLADGAGTVMLEFYNHPKVSVPDYRSIDPLILHIAFSVDDADAFAVGDVLPWVKDLVVKDLGLDGFGQVDLAMLPIPGPARSALPQIAHDSVLTREPEV